MKFSMNGFRRNLSRDVNRLREIVECVLNDEYYDKTDLLEEMNQMVTHSNVINCVYEKDDPDFTDMSDLEIKHIEVADEA